MASARILLRSAVLISCFLVSAISRASSKSLVAFLPVSLDVRRTGAKGRKLKSYSRSSRSLSVFSIRSVFVTTTIIPLPALIISPARAWSSLACGSVASIRSAQTSVSSIAESVRRAENFSIPTSRFPGFLKPAVSRISKFLFLYFISRRLTSRVVPWRELTMACCFFPRVLKSEDLPTFGRPIRARVIFSFEKSFCDLENFGRFFVMANFRSLIPCPVVAEMLKEKFGSRPRKRNSSRGRDSFRSDLLRARKTGFWDFRAFLAMVLSFWSGYFEESTVKIIRSAMSMASAIWS